ncbi:hypothetical protein B0H65DRAFT_82270 [Neurospora tetraspora]|uniref:Uncharacterized protein n=1 Tax=Neurospora tetraspora TaxID=94610 RepID=A0AAE0J1G0_9PEZI|nr:hypothetical protein B0H65DRAFT_82270 [Neurospora tetraspora]
MIEEGSETDLLGVGSGIGLERDLGSGFSGYHSGLEIGSFELTCIRTAECIQEKTAIGTSLNRRKKKEPGKKNQTVMEERAEVQKAKEGLSRRELNPGLERIELMFKLDKLTY